MATGTDLVNAAASFIGQRYSTDPGRDDPHSNHKDCSGLIAAAYEVATGQRLGANVSVTIYQLCDSLGLTISFEEAVGIPGACLLLPENPYDGWGPNGHIGFSDGFGGTVEATPPRVQRLPVGFQPWGSKACLLPGIDYRLTPPAPEPTPSNETLEDNVILVGRSNDNPGVVYAVHPVNGILAAEFTCRVGEEIYGFPPNAGPYITGEGTGNGIPMAMRFVLPHVIDWLRNIQGKSIA